MSDINSVLITGANRGIGLEFVRQLVPTAKAIYAACRSPENAHALNKLAASTNNVHVLPLEVTNEKHIEALRQRLEGTSLDLLINNAGIFKGRNNTIDKDEWSETFAVNVMAPINISRALLTNLKQSNLAIVANITSQMGSIADNGSGGSTIYRSSKAALNAATKSFAIDHADEITTLLLHPGWVRTDMGGPNGMIDAGTSVSGMLNVINNVANDDNGRFINYDGQAIPW